MKLSVCMIVRDEAERLPDALDSVSVVADEIIVCDTGSIDRTRKVAAEQGARLVDFPWCEDFAQARNASLEAAAGDWILVLDADEVLAPVKAGQLQALLADETVAGYQVTMRSPRLDQVQEFSLVRLFRNHPHIRYRFPVHEQIVPALNDWAAARGMVIKPSPLVLEHAGYDALQREAKRPRNRRLLEKALLEHPDEPYLIFQLGAEQVSLLRGEVLPRKGLRRARANLQQAWDLVRQQGDEACRRMPWLPDLAALLGSALTVQGEHRAALDILNTAGDLFPEHPRLVLPLCLALSELELPELNREVSALALRLPLADRCRILGEIDGQESHFQHALQADPSDTFALLGLGKLKARRGEATQALGLVMDAIESSEWNWRAWLLGIELMEQVGLKEKAARWRATFSEEFPGVPNDQSSS